MDKNIMKQQFSIAKDLLSVEDGVVNLHGRPVTKSQSNDVDTVGLNSILNQLVKSVALSAAKKMAKGAVDNIESAIQASLEAHSNTGTYARFF